MAYSSGQRFWNSLVRQVGRDSGRTISNLLFGNRHSTPIRHINGNNDENSRDSDSQLTDSQLGCGCLMVLIVGIIIGGIIFHPSKDKQETNNIIQQDTVLNASYAKWNNVSITDSFTEETIKYDMLYPVVDSVVSNKMVMMRKDGEYYLLSSNTSLFDFGRSNKKATIDIKSSEGLKKITLKNQINAPLEYLTPYDETEQYSICLLVPKTVIPDSGILRIRSKGLIYSFDLDI